MNFLTSNYAKIQGSNTVAQHNSDYTFIGHWWPDLTAPSSPSEGDCYLPAETGTPSDSGWGSMTVSEDELIVYSGGVWVVEEVKVTSSKYLDITDTLDSQNAYIDTNYDVKELSTRLLYEYILVSQDVKIYRTGSILGGASYMVVYYNKYKEPIGGIIGESIDTERYEIPIIDGAKYVSIGFATTGITPKIEIELNSIWHYVQEDFGVENPIVLPAYIDAVVGKQFNLYLKNITKTLDNNVGTIITKVSGDGFIERRDEHIQRTPTAVQNTTLNIWEYNNDGLLIGNKSSVIRYHDPTLNNSSTPSILLLGDSIFYWGDAASGGDRVAKTVYDLLSADGLSYEMVGTLSVNGTYKHEGHRGWAFDNYLNDDTVASETNPFRSGGSFNVSNYVSSNGFSGIDYLIINLSTNDIQFNSKWYGTNEEFQLIIDNATELVDYFISYNSSMKIALCLPSAGSPYHSTINQNMDIFKANMMEIHDRLITKFDNGAYNANVTTLAMGAWIDRYNSYDYEEVAISGRVPDLERKYDDPYHPKDFGYDQFADAIYGKIRCWLAGSI